MGALTSNPIRQSPALLHCRLHAPVSSSVHCPFVVGERQKMASIVDTKYTDLDDGIKKELFRISMKGDWKEVVEKYRENPRVHKAKITRSGNTALHIAVSDKQEDRVEEIVRIVIDQGEAKEVLKIKNERGNTALHLAASMGSLKMCDCIASVDPSLVGARNEENETPLFLAALHGIFVDKLEKESSDQQSRIEKTLNDKYKKYPWNYRTCIDFFGLFGNIFKLVTTRKEEKKEGTQADTENRKKTGDTSGAGHRGKDKKMLSINETNNTELDDATKEDLFRKYMKRDERGVINMYDKDPKVRKAKITSSGDTVLHMAISDGREYIGKVLVDIIRGKSEGKEVLGIKNEQGNTPLHIAASMGSVRICFYIANDDPSLVGAQNMDDETPLFLAALHGKKDAFLCLHKAISDTIDNNECHNYCKRWDGETILHCAIAGDYFDLAFQIIHLYPDLVKSVNKRGFSPLHLLASKPSAFESASHFGPFYKLIYHGINVDPLKEESFSTLERMTLEDTEDMKYLKNYRTRDNSNNLFGLFWKKVKVGSATTRKIREKKEKHTWSVQIMNELVKSYNPQPASTQSVQIMTPFLFAAKYGIVEIVEKMLEDFPNVINDMDENKKNAVLLAAENRQRYVYEILLKRVISRQSVFLTVDKNKNNALHLAAMLGDSNPWPVPGDASQLQWEIKWFEFVKNSMSDQSWISFTYNEDGKTPDDVFRETHKGLLQKGGKWLTDISQSCSVVAGLLVTVAYSSSTTVPGGVTQDTGTPIFEHEPAFQVFAVFSLIAFYSSLSAVVMFLSILISAYQLRDFRMTVFVKLLLGLTALYVSIASTLASFSAGHYFILADKLKKLTVPASRVTCLMAALFAIAQFPLYFKLLWATFKRVPRCSYEE